MKSVVVWKRAVSYGFEHTGRTWTNKLIDSCHSLSNGAEDVVFLCGWFGKAGFSLKVKPSATHTLTSKQRNDALTDACRLELLTADTNLDSCPSCTAVSFVYKLGAKSRVGI
jgi:hypothetical protein